MHLKVIPNVDKALMLAKRQLPELICDAVNLEGINYTLPEVQTLLDGITVGGHSMQDQEITLNQNTAWLWLFKQVKAKKFSLDKTSVCELHALAAKNEALNWGAFRTGGVTIAGTDYLPPNADTLDELWQILITESQQKTDPFEQAIFVFLEMARHQFFFDVNKRMGRFMMNGLLLSQGYPVINVPASKQQTFNENMLAFYPSNDKQPMTDFMLGCLDENVLKIMSET